MLQYESMNNNKQFTKNIHVELCLDLFLWKSSKAIHDRSKNELAHILLIGGTHNKQGSNYARVCTILPLSLNLIKSLKYSGVVLLTVLCVERKFV